MLLRLPRRFQAVSEPKRTCTWQRNCRGGCPCRQTGKNATRAPPPISPSTTCRGPACRRLRRGRNGANRWLMINRGRGLEKNGLLMPFFSEKCGLAGGDEPTFAGVWWGFETLFEQSKTFVCKKSNKQTFLRPPIPSGSRREPEGLDARPPPNQPRLPTQKNQNERTGRFAFGDGACGPSGPERTDFRGSFAPLLDAKDRRGAERAAEKCAISTGPRYARSPNARRASRESGKKPPGVVREHWGSLLATPEDPRNPREGRGENPARPPRGRERGPTPQGQFLSLGGNADRPLRAIQRHWGGECRVGASYGRT
jgi:hypothetical protein